MVIPNSNHQLLDDGYPDVFAVNPKAQGAFSAPGYGSVAKIDRVVAGVLADCGQAGIKAALIISAGFSEVGNCAEKIESAG